MTTPLENLKKLLDDYSPTLQAIAYLLAGAGAIVAIFRKRLHLQRFVSPRRQLLKQLTAETEALKESPALTRSGLSFGDLLESPGLLVEVHLRLLPTMAAHNRSSALTAAEFRRLVFDTRGKLHVCVIGPATSGKSTLARSLFYTAVNALNSALTLSVPIYLDLAVISTLLKIESRPDENAIKQNSRLPDNPRLIIVDGVDEAIYSGHSLAVDLVLNTVRDIDRLVVFCRYSAYREYFSFKGRTSFDYQLQIEEYGVTSLRHYAQALLNFFRQPPQIAENVLHMIDAALDVGALRTPLHVAMAIETASEDTASMSRVDSLVQVYGRYIGMVLDRETSKPGCPISASELQSILESIAALVLDRTPEGSLVRSPGAVASIEDIRAAATKVLGPERASSMASHVVDWVTVRSLFDGDAGGSGASSRWTFTHPSYCDYFVSCSVLSALQSDIQRSRQIFLRLLPQEVDQFVKYALLDNRFRDSLTHIISNVRVVLRSESEKGNNNHQISELCVEQLAYLVAHINIYAATALAKETARTSASLLVKRGIAIGLAFGGIREDLVAYVSELRDELQVCGFGQRNRLNVAHQLAYFGDTDVIQDSSIEQIDLGHASNTISKLLKQATTSVHHPSRLLDLYTLESLIVYGCTHPKVGLLIEEYIEQCTEVCRQISREPDAIIRGASESCLRAINKFQSTENQEEKL
jgi:hypothetical protein